MVYGDASFSGRPANMQAGWDSGVYLSPLYPGDTACFGLLPNPPEPEQMPRVYSRPFQADIGIRSFATELRRPEYYGKRDIVTLASSNYPSDYIPRERDSSPTLASSNYPSYYIPRDRDSSPRVVRAESYTQNSHTRVDLSPRVIRLEDYERERGRSTSNRDLPLRTDLSPRLIRSVDYHGQPIRDASRDLSPRVPSRVATDGSNRDLSERALAAFPFPPELSSGKRYPGRLGRSQDSSPFLRASGQGDMLEMRRSGGYYESSLNQISGQLYSAQKANETAMWMDGRRRDDVSELKRVMQAREHAHRNELLELQIMLKEREKEIRALEQRRRSDAEEAVLAQRSVKDMLEAELVRREREVADLRRQLNLNSGPRATGGPTGSLNVNGHSSTPPTASTLGELLATQQKLRDTELRLQASEDEHVRAIQNLYSQTEQALRSQERTRAAERIGALEREVELKSELRALKEHSLSLNLKPHPDPGRRSRGPATPHQNASDPSQPRHVPVQGAVRQPDSEAARSSASASALPVNSTDSEAPLGLGQHQSQSPLAAVPSPGTPPLSDGSRDSDSGSGSRRYGDRQRERLDGLLPADISGPVPNRTEEDQRAVDRSAEEFERRMRELELEETSDNGRSGDAVHAEKQNLNARARGDDVDDDDAHLRRRGFKSEDDGRRMQHPPQAWPPGDSDREDVEDRASDFASRSVSRSVSESERSADRGASGQWGTSDRGSGSGGDSLGSRGRGLASGGDGQDDDDIDELS